MVMVTYKEFEITTCRHFWKFLGSARLFLLLDLKKNILFVKIFLFLKLSLISSALSPLLIIKLNNFHENTVNDLQAFYNQQ